MRPGFAAWQDWLAGLPRGVPCTLSDFQSLPVGGGVQLNADKLVAPFARPMLVDGIRLRIDYYSGALVGVSFDAALAVHFRAYAGPFALTNDHTVISGLGAREQYLQGEVLPTILNAVGALAPPSTAGGFIPISNSAQYTWLFDEPFYLPSGVPIRCNFTRRGDARDDSVFNVGAGGANAVVSAAIFGRYFREDVSVPKGLAVPIPYATAYVDPTVPTLAMSGNPSQVMGTEIDLRNQTSGVLYAERLIGRLPTRDTQAGIFQGSSTAGGFGEYAGLEPTVRIVRTWSDKSPRDPYGRASHRAMVDSAKPFNAVFDLQSRAVELGGVEVPPGEGFVVTVLKQTTALFAAGPALAVFPVVGLTGVREESW